MQGEGGFIPLPDDFPARLLELCREHGAVYVDDEVQSGVGRTGPVWAIEHYGVEPDLLVSGKSLGGGLPLAAVTGPRRADGRARGRRARRDVRRQPGRLRGGPRRARRDRADELPPALRRARAAACARGWTRSPPRVENVGEVRGLGPMLALELVTDRESKEPAAELAKRTTAGARERGLILLSCGTYGNVIRILVPLVIDDDDLAQGLEILEESLDSSD